MREIFPGVYHWTAFHPAIRTRVSSYFIEPAGVVIDPKLPEEGLEALPGRPRQVLLSTGLHDRDSQQVSEAFGIPIRASREADERLGGSVEVELFEYGDEVAPGVTPIHIGELCDDEGAFHIAVGDGAIAFADGLIRHEGELGFVPDELIGDDPEPIKRGLKQAFRGLETRDFDNLLVAHGEPLVGGGKEALRKFANS